MNGAHLHLMLNHIPVFGVIFGSLILFYGMIRKNESIMQTGFISLVVVALGAIPAFLTGESAEDVIENMQGISKQLIEEHEELGTIGFWMIEAIGLISLLALFFPKVRNTRWLKGSVVLLSLATFGVMIQIGNLGGKIHHEELRDTQTVNSNVNASSEEGDKD